MTIDVPDLVDMISVVDSGARTQYDVFTGPSLPTPHGRAFGGQVIAQAISAASQTAPEDRHIHSMHGYFLRPGDSDQKMTFETARLYDGRSFSTRRTQAYQAGNVLMSMIASFQDDDDGLSHQEPVDLSTIPAADTLPSVWEKYGHLAGNGTASWVLNRPFDFRHVEGDVILDVPERGSRQNVWVRSRDTLPEGRHLHAAALAFASDYLLLDPILRQHGVPWATPGLKGASLDHAMWFHRPFRVDEWLLYTLESPISGNGRGLTHGKFFNAEGELVASVSQESTFRLPNTAAE